MGRCFCNIRRTYHIFAVLNVIFVILGLTLFGFGIWLAVYKKFDVAFFEDISVQIIGGKAIQSIGLALILIGLITIIISALGCIGAYQKKEGLLSIYSILVGLLMLAELAAFITVMVLHVDIRHNYENNLRTIFNDAYVKNETDIQYAVEKLEKLFECCGVDGSNDYVSINRTIPSSCYKNQETSGKLPYTIGCANATIDWIWKQMPKIGGIIGAVMFLEFFGLIASRSLRSAVMRPDRL